MDSLLTLVFESMSDYNVKDLPANLCWSFSMSGHKLCVKSLKLEGYLLFQHHMVYPD